jgi:hypothetical protein
MTCFKSSTALLPAALLAGAALTPMLAQSSKIAQTEVRLEPTVTEPVAHDQFGTVVAASGNGKTLAISGITADDGTISEVGAVFIYDLIDNEWVQSARLFPGDGIEDETLGFDMAISADGNTVVAGPLIHNGVFFHEGAVYVFQRVNGTWSQEAELLSPTPGNSEAFGSWGVAISGDTLIAGDLGGPTNGFIPGVDVFTRVNGNWQLSATIQLPDDFDFSPATVAIHGNTIVVGNNGANLGNGAAWVFGLMNGTWTLQAKLSPSDLTPGSQFGVMVVAAGNSVIVGAPSAPGASAFSGAVYVFHKQGTGWVQTAKVIASDGVSGDGFGTGVDVNGESMAIGAAGRSTSAGFSTGAVYLFHVNDGQWTQSDEFAGSDLGTGGGFGGSVALRKGTLLVGAFGQHPQPNNAPYPEGEAYVYKVN